MIRGRTNVGQRIFLYLIVSSSCYRYDLQVVLSSKYSTRWATLWHHTLCMCASLQVSAVLVNRLAISINILYVLSCVLFHVF